MNVEHDKVKVSLDEMWPVMMEQLKEGKSVRFGPKGTSMMPMIRQGVDSVSIKKAPSKLKKYDIPLYRRTNGQFVLHRVVAVKKDSYVMRGDNQYINEYDVRHDQVLAVVEGFYRGEKYISCRNIKYILYTRAIVWKREIFYLLKRIKDFLVK